MKPKPVLTKCADWDEDVPPSRNDEFKKRIEEALNRVEKSLRIRLPLDSDFMSLHKLLFDSFVPERCYAGNFRQLSDEPANRCLAMNVEIGGIVATDFHAVTSAITELVCDCEDLFGLIPRLPKTEHAASFAGTAAYVIGEFIRIHPFVNGNGRISRILWYWLCRRMGVSPMVQIHPRPPVKAYGGCMAECMKGNDAPLGLAILQTLAAIGEQPIVT